MAFVFKEEPLTHSKTAGPSRRTYSKNNPIIYQKQQEPASRRAGAIAPSSVSEFDGVAATIVLVQALQGPRDPGDDETLHLPANPAPEEVPAFSAE
jgi:hypothetical protein